MVEENLEQGFNDSELADIMDEIEDLEKEFLGDDIDSPLEEKEDDLLKTTAEPKTPPPKLRVVEDPPAPVVEDSENRPEELAVSPSPPQQSEVNVAPEGEVVDETLLETKALEEAGQKALNEVAIAETQETQEVAEVQEAPKQSDNFKNYFLKESKREAKVLEQAYTEKKETPMATPMASPEKIPHSSVSMDLSGTLNFSISLKVEEQTLSLKLDKNEGLIIELDSGAHFVIPLKKK